MLITHGTEGDHPGPRDDEEEELQDSLPGLPEDPSDTRDPGDAHVPPPDLG